MSALEHDKEAERLLSEANLWRVRGEPSKAEECAAKAVALAPENAAARELHGDTLQLLGELERALAEYGEAVRIAPERASAEDKFARVTLALAAERARGGATDSTDPEAVLKAAALSSKRKSPSLAAVYSLILPGAGQIYLGERERGVVMLGAWLFLGLMLLLPMISAVLQLCATMTNSSLPGKGAESSPWGIVGMLLLLAISIYSAIDAYRIGT